MGKWALPEDIVGAVIFFSAEASSLSPARYFISMAA